MQAPKSAQIQMIDTMSLQKQKQAQIQIQLPKQKALEIPKQITVIPKITPERIKSIPEKPIIPKFPIALPDDPWEKRKKSKKLKVKSYKKVNPIASFNQVMTQIFNEQINRK